MELSGWWEGTNIIFDTRIHTIIINNFKLYGYIIIIMIAMKFSYFHKVRSVSLNFVLLGNLSLIVQK